MHDVDSLQIQLRLHLDTSAINLLLDNPSVTVLLQSSVLDGSVILFHTHIQVDEIADTADSHGNRRNELFDVLLMLESNRIDSSVFVMDYSKLDFAEIGDDDSNRMSTDLSLNSARRIKDSIIATTAIAKRTTLVVSDLKLEKRLRNLGYSFWTFNDLNDFLKSSLIDSESRLMS